MRVAQVSFYTDPAGRTPEQLLRDWSSLVDVAECATCAGAKVCVVQASAYTQKLSRDGVDYYFLPFGGGVPRGHTDEAFVRLLRKLAPDVLHIHGLGFP